MTRAKGWAVVLLAAAFPIGYFAWELYLSPEARVRRTLNGAADAAKTADVDRFVSYLTSDYRDYIHADRERIAEQLREAFSRIDRLNVTLQNVDVAVEGEEATVRFDVVIVAVRGEERYVVVGTPFEPEKVTARLRREGGEWKVAAVDRRAAD